MAVAVTAARIAVPTKVVVEVATKVAVAAAEAVAVVAAVALEIHPSSLPICRILAVLLA